MSDPFRFSRRPARDDRRTWLIAGAAAALLIAALAADADAALAARNGRASYSGTLSSNKAIRKQQLIVDPENILGGSASTFYDPSLVSLVGFLTDAPFITQNTLIGVTLDAGLTRNLVPVSAFFADRGLTGNLIGPNGQAAGADPGAAATLPPSTMRETGYVQFGFAPNPNAITVGPASIKPPPGYTVVDEAGPTEGEDSHALLFDFIGPPNQVATYTVFADDGSTTGQRDFLIVRDERGSPTPLLPEQIDAITVSGALDPNFVPIPTAAWTGMTGLAAAWVAARRVARR